MTRPPLPKNETARLAALKSTGLLEVTVPAVLEDLTALAARICQVPIALVSLVDRDRQVFRAAIGTTLAGTPREHSFCAHAVADGRTLVVGDAARDPRFADNPLVTGPPHIRFYAGVPLFADTAHAIGTLCIMDSTPRHIGAVTEDMLTRLARLAGLQIEDMRRRRLESSR